MISLNIKSMLKYFVSKIKYLKISSLPNKSMLKYFVSKIKYLKISSLPDTVMIVSPLYSTFSKHLAKNISI